MEDLFRSYWWLMFPMAWFVVGGFTSFLNYRRQKETLDLLRTYAEKGQEPPEALLKVLNRPIDSDTEFFGGAYDAPSKSNEGNWFSVVLFGLLAAGFGYAAWADMYGAGQAFLIVAFVLGSVCVACLVSTLMKRGRRRGGE
ncbi:MAG TPA: hypothetical protein PLQ03_04655 [Brevundimonas sp.]|uniref:hypothetical protein n=1 Tax=Brevundimonas sp. TaxID=1871086 RepID=UPI00263798B8|nr:hypothetical protein [Brevundimonas sp.]HRO32685.1 hypothetical protein [Brevundimonas sp.]